MIPMYRGRPLGWVKDCRLIPHTIRWTTFWGEDHHIPVILAGLILFSAFSIPSVQAGMGDPSPAKRCIEIIHTMIFETSSPKVSEAFRRSIARCYAETMWDDMARTGCRCNSGFDLDECAKRAAAPITPVSPSSPSPSSLLVSLGRTLRVLPCTEV